MPALRTKLLPILLLSTTLLATFLTGFLLPVRGQVNFSEPLPVPMGANLPSDSKLQFLDAAHASGTVLKSDLHIKYVDTNGNNVWDPGEPVVYDTNNNGLYLSTDPVIAGAPTQLATLLVDSKIKFVDVNNYGVWAAGEPVVYDGNNNNMYDAGEPVVAGSPPRLQATLNQDSKVKFVDANSNGVWDSGETIVYHSTNDGLYESSESVILLGSPAPETILSVDSRIKYWDANGDSIWDNGEAVVYDTFGQGYYNATTDSHIRYYDKNNNGIWDPGTDSVVYDKNSDGLYECTEAVIAGPQPPCLATLTMDKHFRFMDSARTGRWAAGDAVIYDMNLDNIYDAGDVMVAGTEAPIGTLLSETVISGSVPPIGTRLKTDLKIKFSDTNSSRFWHPGEAVVN